MEIFWFICVLNVVEICVWVDVDRLSVVIVNVMVIVMVSV